MSNFLSFAFEGISVRVASSDPFNPLFIAIDVAKALGYKKPENAIARHCKRQNTTPKQGVDLLLSSLNPIYTVWLFVQTWKVLNAFKIG